MDKPVALKPFFSYYGGKWRTARRYPQPQHATVIEPFAGSAGYAVRYFDRKVKLYDAYEKVAGVWDYLINVSEDELRRLPTVVHHVDDVQAPDEAKWLIGFWLNAASPQPKLTPSKWALYATDRSQLYWGQRVIDRLVAQVPYIRHWTIEHLDYTMVPLDVGTWFVDPPYNHKSGTHYLAHVEDFEKLGRWCEALPGQAIVCERLGADWLPFEPCPWATKSIPPGRGYGYSPEVMWTNA